MATLMVIWEPKQWWNPTARQGRGALLLTVNQMPVSLHVLVLLLLAASVVLAYCKSLNAIGLCFWLYWVNWPSSVKFYEGGMRFSESRPFRDIFVTWDQVESYYWDEDMLCLRVKKTLFQQDTQHRRIRVPAVQMKAVAALFAAHVG